MVRRLTRRDFLNLAALAAGGPIFDLKPLRGIDFILENSPTPRKFLIETMPGGVALFDYNNDGLLDVFLVNGGRITEALRVPENFDRIVMEALLTLRGLRAWRVQATATTAWA